MRLIVLDTETTGLKATGGDRIVELGCVVMENLRKGATRQWYINPERPIPAEATAVHGITDAKVAKAPKFAEIVTEFLELIQDSQLVIHNASFDLGFLNAELARCQLPPLEASRAIDTLTLARRKFPGAQANLDALCRRFGIDTSRRNFHGALLDAELLAEVYIELTGGSQFRLQLDQPTPAAAAAVALTQTPTPRRHWPAREWPLTPEEEQAHHACLELVRKEGGSCIWLE